MRVGTSGSDEFAAAQRTIEAFEASVSGADIAGAERLLHRVWKAKVAGPDGAGGARTRDDCLAGIGAREARPAYATTSVQLCPHDLAVVRADDYRHAAAVLYFLLRDNDGSWRIVGEASASAEVGYRPAHFEHRATEVAVLEVMAEYYRAVTEGDAGAIQKIFAPFWQMKNHEGGVIVAEDRAAFVARIEPGPLPGYWDDRQIADVQVIYDRLAYVRVDKPSTPSTTVFAFMKLNGHWRVIDKVWVDGRVEVTSTRATRGCAISVTPAQ